ncbi:L,D-transpeptidase [Aureimonas sp. AU40]|uniref:L,D-transpeptidase n=1 Tax=Aureimonas sp. AU40 TaxID=1637747 RepID=UPI0007816C43|nr:L,D-transpeptidase [Aureimonas sp. AU40]
MFARRLLALSLVLAAGSAADARDRRPLSLDREDAAQRVLQLSPGSGVVPGYQNPKLTRGYPAGTVIFDGNIPVGVVRRDGGPVEPLGSYQNAQPIVLGAEPGPPPRPRAERRRERQPLFASAGAPARSMAAAPRQTQPRGLDPAFLPQEVVYSGYEPGTIVIDTQARFLYLVEAGGRATRYGVGVGKPGFEWAGSHRVSRKAEWPDWTPPSEMVARERAKGRILPARMEGGIENPLGARALYLGSSLYRIHGTNQPWTIGQAVSSGCIRMRNEDVSDLYERVPVGTRVVVL